jgi:hypothetical protein
VCLQARGLQCRVPANVACFIDWLRIAARNDWLDPARPDAEGGNGKVKQLRRGVRKKMEAGVKAAKELLDRRSVDGLDLPYGPKAKALGLGEETPAV